MIVGFDCDHVRSLVYTPVHWQNVTACRELHVMWDLTHLVVVVVVVKLKYCILLLTVQLFFNRFRPQPEMLSTGFGTELSYWYLVLAYKGSHIVTWLTWWIASTSDSHNLDLNTTAKGCIKMTQTSLWFVWTQTSSHLYWVCLKIPKSKMSS